MAHPLCYHNDDGSYTYATHQIVGQDPDRKGGGIQAWAYSQSEAERIAEDYRKGGYHDIKVEEVSRDA